MIYRITTNISGSGELPLKLPQGQCRGVIFNSISGSDTELVGLRTSDKTVIPLTPLALVRRVSGSAWTDNIIRTGFDTKTYLRLVFNTSAPVELELFFFIEQTQEGEKDKFDVKKLNASEFAGDTVRVNVKGKIRSIDLISFSRDIEWSVSDGYEKFLEKRTATTDYTQKKQSFLNLLFPVEINSRFIDIEVKNIQPGETFYLVYRYD